MNGLGTQVPHAKVLYFDDHDFTGPRNLLDWVDQGADYHAWDLTALVGQSFSLTTRPVVSLGEGGSRPSRKRCDIFSGRVWLQRASYPREVTCTKGAVP